MQPRVILMSGAAVALTVLAAGWAGGDIASAISANGYGDTPGGEATPRANIAYGPEEFELSDESTRAEEQPDYSDRLAMADEEGIEARIGSRTRLIIAEPEALTVSINGDQADVEAIIDRSLRDLDLAHDQIARARLDGVEAEKYAEKAVREAQRAAAVGQAQFEAAMRDASRQIEQANAEAERAARAAKAERARGNTE